jgi:hypothetical protein
MAGTCITVGRIATLFSKFTPPYGKSKLYIPQPLLPPGEQGSRIRNPSAVLGEGFRVRATKVGCTRNKCP